MSEPVTLRNAAPDELPGMWDNLSAIIWGAVGVMTNLEGCVPTVPKEESNFERNPECCNLTPERLELLCAVARYGVSQNMPGAAEWLARFEALHVPAPSSTQRAAPVTTQKLWYISAVDGRVRRHSTWAECERVVKGVSMAQFTKVRSRHDEIEALTRWGMRNTKISED